MSLYAVILQKSFQKDKKMLNQESVKTNGTKANGVQNNGQSGVVILTNDELAKSKFIPIIKLEFSNIKVNKGITDSIFEIKDNRIFDEDD